MIINRKVSVAGRYTIYSHRPGQKKRKIAAFDNLITNSGMDLLGTTTRWGRYVRLGTGTTTPAFTDVALANQVHVSSGTSSDAAGPGTADYSSVILTWVLPQGAVVGNLSEIGVSESSSSNLFSRALIVDGSGNPTTITVTSLDILTVVYEVRMYFDKSDYTNTVTVNSTLYTMTSRGSQQDSVKMLRWYTFGLFASGGADSVYLHTGASIALGPLTGSLQNATYIGPSGAVSGATYTPGSYFRDLVFAVSISQGNHANGITGWSMFDSNNYWAVAVQTVVSPAIMKTNTMSMTITIRVNWARYTP